MIRFRFKRNTELLLEPEEMEDKTGGKKRILEKRLYTSLCIQRININDESMWPKIPVDKRFALLFFQMKKFSLTDFRNHRLWKIPNCSIDFYLYFNYKIYYIILL